MGIRLLLMPLVAGISYEIIKFAGKSKNKCVMILNKPGMWLQRFTTREPDDSQIEVAIASLKAVIPEDKDVVYAPSDYHGEFCCAIKKDNLLAVQFHPEKSAHHALAFFASWSLL